MPSTNDFIRTAISFEYAGVQGLNTFFWRVQDIGTDPLPNVVLGEVVQQYYDSLKNIMCDQWKLGCAAYENLTSFEPKEFIFPSDPGL
ncbi:unnamed protein product, partial [marine sediment metagenome]